MKLSFLWKSTLLVSTLIIVVGVAVSLLIYIFGYQYALDNRKTTIGLMTTQIAEIISYNLDESKQLAVSIAGDPLTKTILSGIATKENKDELTVVFSHYGTTAKPLAIYLMDVNGLTLASTDPTFINKNYGFRKYFKEAISGVDYIDFSVGVTSNEPGYYFSSPVRDSKQQIIGVLVVKKSDEFLDAAIESFFTEETDRLFENIMVVDEYGVVTTAYEKDKELRHLGGISQDQKQALLVSERYGKSKLDELSYSALFRDLYRANTYIDFSFFDERDGENEYLGLLNIPGTGFSVVIETYSSFVEGSASGFSGKLLITVIAGVILATLFSMLILIKIASPLGMVKVIAERVSRGDYKYREWVRTGDEFEEIAESIYRLADTRGQKNDEISSSAVTNKEDDV